MHQLNEQLNFGDDASVQLVVFNFPELFLRCLLACTLIEWEKLINARLSLFDILEKDVSELDNYLYQGVVAFVQVLSKCVKLEYVLGACLDDTQTNDVLLFETLRRHVSYQR